MRIYKFKTRISKTGQIQLPLNRQLFDKEVEIIILPKQKQKPSKLKMEDFINKWSGFLSNPETDDAKYQYLMEKYNG